MTACASSPERWQPRAAVQPPWQRPHLPFSLDCQNRGSAALELVHHRRRLLAGPGRDGAGPDGSGIALAVLPDDGWIDPAALQDGTRTLGVAYAPSWSRSGRSCWIPILVPSCWGRRWMSHNRVQMALDSCLLAGIE